MLLIVIALAAPVVPASFECGPGYSKPATYARCQPERGRSLLHGCSPKLKPQLLFACLRQRG